MMKFPTEWKVIKFHGSSHHQPVTLDGLDGVFGGKRSCSCSILLRALHDNYDIIHHPISISSTTRSGKKRDGPGVVYHSLLIIYLPLNAGNPRFSFGNSDQPPVPPNQPKQFML